MSKEEKNKKEIGYPGFAWDPPYAMVTADYRLCSGCRICEVACSVKNFGEFNPELSKIRIYDFYAGLLQVPSICWGCQWKGGEDEGGLDAPCVKACPVKAISWHETLWIPVVDETLCVKCDLCYKACQQHAIKENPKTGFPNVCTRCDGDPECVKQCPTGALAAYKTGEGSVDTIRAYGMRSIESVVEDAKIHHLHPWKELEDWKKILDEKRCANMVYGYCNKFLDVDLTSRSIRTTPFDDEFARKYLGGLGFGAKLLFDRVKKGVDPLSQANVLMLMFGPLNGGSLPGQKACWIFKSPLTGGIGRARSGGAYTVELKRAGWDGIIFTGKADSLVYLYVKDDNVEIRDAKHLSLRDTQYTEHTIKQELEDPFTRVVCCGPAGENLVRFASIQTETTRAAARCGGGAVMGSKNLKAVAIRGTRNLPLKNPDEFNNLAKQIRYRATKARGIYPFRQRFVRFHTCSHSGATHPLRNYSWSGHVEEAYKINTERQERRFYLRNHSCPSFCYGHCFEHGITRHGPYSGISGENSEWDTSPTILGTGLTDVEAAMAAVSLLDKLGMDGSSCGNTMAWAIECYQKGLLTKEDTAGFELTWDNPALVIKLLKKIAFREGPFATLLGEGTKRATNTIGRNSIEYACQARGLENAAVDPRAAYPTAVGQATSARGGGDHLTDRNGHMDSLCVCMFTQLAAGGITNEDLVTFVNYSTGWDYTEEELTKTFFERLLSLQRAFNVREFWPTTPSEMDYNALKFYREPIYAGPLKGTVLDKSKFEDERAAYYELRGWDERGIPTKDTLKEHGLEDILAELEGIGIYE